HISISSQFPIHATLKSGKEPPFTAGQELKDAESGYLVSAGGTFRLRFFSPGSSNNRYLGMWYNQPQPADRKAVPFVLSSPARTASNVSATLLDSGNFIIRELSSDGSTKRILPQRCKPMDNLVERVALLDQRVKSWRGQRQHLFGAAVYTDPITFLPVASSQQRTSAVRILSNSISIAKLPLKANSSLESSNLSLYDCNANCSSDYSCVAFAYDDRTASCDVWSRGMNSKSHPIFYKETTQLYFMLADNSSVDETEVEMRNKEGKTNQELQFFSLETIAHATNNFAATNKLGEGGFGPVYKNVLDWKKRYNIIESVGQGLLYLHKYSRLKVIHRDLKGSNILLLDDMNPKISDFCMAKIFGHHDSKANTERIVGTGYMSPEYAMDGIYSTRSDMFSFGVLLLEIITGRKHNSFHSLSGPLSLVAYAWEAWNEGRALELIDPSLGESYPKDEVMRCIHVGPLCGQDNPVDRPTILDALSMMYSEGNQLPTPKPPAYYFSRNRDEPEIVECELQIFSPNNLSITEMEAR
ncbi:hypothetical protein Gorai_011774, partial [Gossypium raimondii]|nr:hypothetical protein [Gossypium raimondii]